jgi:hypothetical protein
MALHLAPAVRAGIADAWIPRFSDREWVHLLAGSERLPRKPPLDGMVGRSRSRGVAPQPLGRHIGDRRPDEDCLFFDPADAVAGKSPFNRALDTLLAPTASHFQAWRA